MKPVEIHRLSEKTGDPHPDATAEELLATLQQGNLRDTRFVTALSACRQRSLHEAVEPTLRFLRDVPPARLDDAPLTIAGVSSAIDLVAQLGTMEEQRKLLDLNRQEFFPWIGLSLGYQGRPEAERFLIWMVERPAGEIHPSLKARAAAMLHLRFHNSVGLAKLTPGLASTDNALFQSALEAFLMVPSVARKDIVAEHLAVGLRQQQDPNRLAYLLIYLASCDTARPAFDRLRELLEDNRKANVRFHSPIHGQVRDFAAAALLGKMPRPWHVPGVRLVHRLRARHRVRSWQITST